MGEKAKDATRFLRRRWWVGLIMSTLLAIAGAYGGYTILEPYFRDLRQEHLMTKADLLPLESSLSLGLRDLSERLNRLEHSRNATLDDLDILKTVLEREIASLRSTAK